MQSVQSVRFYAVIPKANGQGSDVKSTFFGIGEGSGQKEIKGLTVDIQPTYVDIQQRTADGETKRFIYKFADISGRLEIVEA